LQPRWQKPTNPEAAPPRSISVAIDTNFDKQVEKRWSETKRRQSCSLRCAAHLVGEDNAGIR